MTVRVVGASGVPVTAATLDDISGDAYVLPAATTAVIGGVKKWWLRQIQQRLTLPGSWLTLTHFWQKHVLLE